MGNQLAGHTNSYHTYGHDEALAGIAAAGYRYVELSAVPGWTEHVDLGTPPAETRRKLDGLRARGGEPLRALGPDDRRRARPRDQGCPVGGRVRPPDRQHRGRRPSVRGRERERVPRQHRGDGGRRRRGRRRRRARDPRRHHGLERRHHPAAREDRPRLGQGQLRHGQRRVLLGRQGSRRPAEDHAVSRAAST